MASDFLIELRPLALRQLRALDRTDQSLLGAAISNLATDLRPNGSRRLRTRRGYLLNVNNCRVIYTIDVHALLVVIVAVRRHGDVPSN
ncbi:MAG TPA: type II toxin-antitoxin system RelE/ParE family toxin [Acidimicrobiales bacterium]